MAYTIQQVITAVQRRLPDANTTVCTQYANQIHRHILAEVPELRRDVVTVNMVNGQQEYAIGETLFQIDYAYYATAAGVGQQLYPTNVESLNQTSQTWRFDASGVPTSFYITSTNISGTESATVGLVPAPNTTTSAGYPLLSLYGSVLQASDLGLSDSCLPTIQSSQVYVEGVSFLAAADIRPQMAGAYKAEFEYQLQLVKKYARTRSEMLKFPGFANIRGGGYQEQSKGG